MFSRRVPNFLENLEPRLLMAADAGALLTALPPLAQNSSSQASGIIAVQLGANEGVVEALGLQAGSSLDLAGTLPSPFLAQQFVAQPTPLPALLPDSMVEAPAVT